MVIYGELIAPLLRAGDNALLIQRRKRAVAPQEAPVDHYVAGFRTGAVEGQHEEVLREIAAGSVASTVSGLHHNGVGATGGSCTDHTSGLENRFNVEVAHACLGLSRQDANGLVLECLSRYEENHMKNPPQGRPFAQLYNTDTLEPGEEWLGLYHRVRDGLISMGLDLDGGWKRARRG